jgi:hypothetical protein
MKYLNLVILITLVYSCSMKRVAKQLPDLPSLPPLPTTLNLPPLPTTLNLPPLPATTTTKSPITQPGLIDFINDGLNNQLNNLINKPIIGAVNSLLNPLLGSAVSTSYNFFVLLLAITVMVVLRF